MAIFIRHICGERKILLDIAVLQHYWTAEPDDMKHRLCLQFILQTYTLAYSTEIIVKLVLDWAKDYA